MRLSDGIETLEISTWREPVPDGEPIAAVEFERILRRLAPYELERLASYVADEAGGCHFGPPSPTEMVDRTLRRLRDGFFRVYAHVPSGSSAGEVPTDDEVQELSELASEDDFEVAASTTIDGPVMIAAEDSVDEPPIVEPVCEVAPPDIPVFDCDIEAPLIPAVDVEIAPPS